MRLLLDTHIWIWSLQGSERLAPRVKRLLGSPKNELWLSPISVWELLLLQEAKRIRIHTQVGFDEWLEEAFASGSFKEAVLSRNVAAMTRAVSLEHQDPADRFLAATAAVYDLTLVTADEKLLRGKGFRVLANA